MPREIKRGWLKHDEWLAWRKGGLGSSDAPIVMRASPWTTRYELWADKTNQQPITRTNAAMRRGLAMEPIAREAYEQLIGFATPQGFLEHEKHNFVRASFDGINEHKRRAVEIKCPGRVDHAIAKEGQIPEKYLWQCVHLLLVSGFDTLDYWSFNGEEGVLVTLSRCLNREQVLLEQEIQFWHHVTERTPPL